MVIVDEPKRQMLKDNERAAVDVLQSVLQVRHRRVRHEAWTVDLQQRRALDALHMSPQVTVVATEIAEPAATGPWLERHRKCLAIGRLIETPQLGNNRVERVFERRAHEYFVLDGQRQIV